uniref:Uncharacterized protein n=1 Tax=Meloidogyne enterolobii TaxID=390850 RepID=A0A6V7UD58_MELEN|nr:unnamed protein product [Meloidogyne enterolobii]
MYFLPPENQLDILKCLNWGQLLNMQQTNKFYKKFIKQYENDLALKKFHKLEIFTIDELSLTKFKFSKPDPKFYEFQLTEHQEKTWKYIIDNSIPMFLKDDDTNVFLVISVMEHDGDFKAQGETY